MKARAEGIMMVAAAVPFPFPVHANQSVPLPLHCVGNVVALTRALALLFQLGGEPVVRSVPFGETCHAPVPLA